MSVERRSHLAVVPDSWTEADAERASQDASEPSEPCDHWLKHIVCAVCGYPLGEVE
jgi:hypothetical protein